MRLSWRLSMQIRCDLASASSRVFREWAVARRTVDAQPAFNLRGGVVRAAARQQRSSLSESQVLKAKNGVRLSGSASLNRPYIIATVQPSSIHGCAFVRPACWPHVFETL